MDPRFVAGVLLKCALMGFAVLSFWFAGFLFAGEWAYGIHSSMFQITRHDFDLINYCGMVVVKLFVILGFLIPWAAIRLSLASAKP